MLDIIGSGVSAELISIDFVAANQPFERHNWAY